MDWLMRWTGRWGGL